MTHLSSLTLMDAGIVNTKPSSFPLLSISNFNDRTCGGVCVKGFLVILMNTMALVPSSGLSLKGLCHSSLPPTCPDLGELSGRTEAREKERVNLGFELTPSLSCLVPVLLPAWISVYRE